MRPRMPASARRAWALALACAAVLAASHAHADPSCGALVTRDNLVPCAIRASFKVQAETHVLGATHARKKAVSPILPSNPVVMVSAARRDTTAQASTNFYGQISQEIEVAGQRGKRREVADAQVSAQRHRLDLSRREAAVHAWDSYFDLVAANDEVRVMEHLLLSADRVATVATARAESGLIAPVDADVAAATRARIYNLKLTAERSRAHAEAVLASLLGFDPERSHLQVAGDLEPLGVIARGGGQPLEQSHAEAPHVRPEMLALDADRRAQEKTAEAYRRARVPNPALQVYVQNDGFNERVIGGGFAVPLPIPGNIGRTYNGEIDEAEARAMALRATGRETERKIRLELAMARANYRLRNEEVGAYPKSRLDRAEATLASLALEIETGRIAVRDAVVAQRALIELLRANVQARHALCLASVRLAKALGLPLERGIR